MVYTDGIHLTADSLDELYNYANKVGLNPDWIHFGGKNIHPHFDICGNIKTRVLADLNVKKVSCKEIVRLCKLNFRVPETEEELQEFEQHNKMKDEKIELPSQQDYERMIDNIFKKTGIKRS